MYINETIITMLCKYTCTQSTGGTQIEGKINRARFKINRVKWPILKCIERRNWPFALLWRLYII